jgi:hypothetical protein
MSAVISPVTGTRVEPIDSYQFVRGTAATFKVIFINNGVPVTVDNLTTPQASIFEPMFLNKSGSTTPVVIATLNGTLVPGQQFEYQFIWNIPADIIPSDEYIISYRGTLGGDLYPFGDEYINILASAGQIGIKTVSYATISDVRMMKFNIDEYLPETIRKDLTARNNVIEFHLRNAATKLREELALFRARGNTENYKLFCIYYTVWSIMLASRGEDGSSVSDQNLTYWRTEWSKILDQEKRKGANSQGISFGRG